MISNTEMNPNNVNLFALAAAAIANANDSKKDPAAVIPEDESVLALARLGGLGGRVWAYKETTPEAGGSSYSSSSPPGGGPQWL
jgi:hypothetical protein